MAKYGSACCHAQPWVSVRSALRKSESMLGVFTESTEYEGLALLVREGWKTQEEHEVTQTSLQEEAPALRLGEHMGEFGVVGI